MKDNKPSYWILAILGICRFCAQMKLYRTLGLCTKFNFSLGCMSEVHLCCLSFLGITALESKREDWEAAFCSLISREIPGPLTHGWLPWGLLSTGYLLLNWGFSTIKWHKSESGHFRMNITAWRPPCPTKSCFEDSPGYDLSDDASALKVKGRGKDSLQITELWPYALAEF